MLGTKVKSLCKRYNTFNHEPSSLAPISLKEIIYLVLMLPCASCVCMYAFEEQSGWNFLGSWGWPWTPDLLVPSPKHRCTPCQQGITPILLLLLLGEKAGSSSLPVICSVLLGVGIWFILHFFQVQQRWAELPIHNPFQNNLWVRHKSDSNLSFLIFVVSFPSG